MNQSATNDALQFLLQRLPARLYSSNDNHQDRDKIVQDFRAMRLGDIPIEDPFEYIDRSLSRETRRHVLISGPRGVGKTTFAQSYLARSVTDHSNEFEQALWIDCRQVGLEDTRGCWESLLTACSEAGNWLVCVEGFASMLERPQGASNEPLVHTFAQFPHVRLIAIVGEEERQDLYGRGASLLELFTPMELAEPPAETVETILLKRLESLRQAHRIGWEDQFIERLLNLCDAYFLNRCYPAKACILLDHTLENATFGRTQESFGDLILGVSDLETAAQELTGVTVKTKHSTPGSVVSDALNRRVFAQPEAIQACSRELEIIRAGLNDAGKPASVLMFAGTTGVGKSELAKTLAEIYSHSRKLHVYSMGNYTEPHSVSGIIGVPAGYVGHDEGGQLVNQLLADPFSVFLLDEAEKAHANVWKPFLNLFDEGWIVDQRGRKANGENAIFIMTTNAGERTIQQMFRDEKPYGEIVQRVKETLVRFRSERSSQPVFSEQFLSRINDVVVFRPLGLEGIQEIAKAALTQLRVRWEQRMAITLEYSEDFLERLARYCAARNEASSGKEGGRIVRRTVRQEIENRLLEFQQEPSASEYLESQSNIRLDWLEPEESTDETLPRSPRIELEWIPAEGLVESVV